MTGRDPGAWSPWLSRSSRNQRQRSTPYDPETVLLSSGRPLRGGAPEGSALTRRLAPLRPGYWSMLLALPVRGYVAEGFEAGVELVERGVEVVGPLGVAGVYRHPDHLGANVDQLPGGRGDLLVRLVYVLLQPPQVLGLGARAGLAAQVPHGLRRLLPLERHVHEAFGGGVQPGHGVVEDGAGAVVRHFYGGHDLAVLRERGVDLLPGLAPGKPPGPPLGGEVARLQDLWLIPSEYASLEERVPGPQGDEGGVRSQGERQRPPGERHDEEDDAYDEDEHVHGAEGGGPHHRAPLLRREGRPCGYVRPPIRRRHQQGPQRAAAGPGPRASGRAPGRRCPC